MTTEKTCFVMMSIGTQKTGDTEVTKEQLRENYDSLIKEAILKARPNLKVVRADDISEPGILTNDIIERIMNSDYVVADITYPNPNVYYELGLRHACRVGTILIKDKNGPPVPFDVAQQRRIVYANTPPGLQDLSLKLKKYFDSIDNNPNRPDNQFQVQAERETYKFPDYGQQKGNTFLDACRASGILEIFPNRRLAEGIFREAVDKAAARSKEVDLLGVSLYSLFGHTDTKIMGRLTSPDVQLRILLLDGSSPAADRRAKIEDSGTTLQEIENARKTVIPDLVYQRICKRIKKDNNFEKRVETFDKGNPIALDELITELKLNVHLYDHDPIMYMMRFCGSLFTEQYHFGRPLSQLGGRCIGTYVPVIQCARGAEAYKYLSAHFQYDWENSKDISHEVVLAGVEQFIKTK
ncbi:MAG: hypothetical protein FWH56_11160 [Betaproteobacteria bacterium]|nr:hypothetical protein [Betaproteobacteria bacterium]